MGPPFRRCHGAWPVFGGRRRDLGGARLRRRWGDGRRHRVGRCGRRRRPLVAPQDRGNGQAGGDEGEDRYGAPAQHTAAAALKNALGPQPIDLRLAEAQALAQHLVGVLAQHGGWPAVIDIGLRKPHGAGDQVDLAAADRRMVHFQLHAPRLHMRVVENLLDIVDGPAANPQFAHAVEPELRRLGGDDLAEFR